jgi:hypothetical protein
MVILRLLALIFIVVALMLLGADAVTTLEKGGAIMLRSLATDLALVHGDPSMWVQMALPASIANVLMIGLGFPGWAVIGVLGVLLAAISFSRRE